MTGVVGMTKRGIELCITHLPNRKKPCLAVKIDNCIYKVASFDNEVMTDWFIEIVEEMFGERRMDDKGTGNT